MMVNLKGKQVTVIGGGKVAYRKVKNLLLHGCNITVVAPWFRDEFKGLEGSIKQITKYYNEELLKGSFIVVAATSEKTVNEAIAIYCDKHNMLCNVVDTPERSSFIVPASITRGDLTISICTNGKSPSLSRRIKEEIGMQYGEEYAPYVVLLGRLRELVLQEITSEEERKTILTAASKMSFEALTQYYETCSKSIFYSDVKN
ncbi:MAG: bifunctional precorrin-2 dehydrogenase/sirohydrochlorin ferrochelatase [Cellulosilyticaceae bacterium]